MAQETDQQRQQRLIREKNEELERAETKRRTDEANAKAEREEKARIERESANIPGGHKLYDVKNPLRAARVIYDGINDKDANDRPHTQIVHTINGKSTKRGVMLHEDVVKEMKDRNRKNPNSDLIITPHNPNKSNEEAADDAED